MDEAVTRVLLDDHALPSAFATGHVEVRRITMAPNVAAGPHAHNGPVFGILLNGSVRFQVGDGPTSTLTAGDTFSEPADALIARFDTEEAGASFVAWFLLAPGEPGRLSAWAFTER